MSSAALAQSKSTAPHCGDVLPKKVVDGGWRGNGHAMSSRQLNVLGARHRSRAKNCKASDALRLLESDLERDAATERVAHKVSRVPTEVVHHGDRVQRQLLHRDRCGAWRVAGSYAAVVEPRAPVVGLQSANLRPPAFAVNARALDEQSW